MIRSNLTINGLYQYDNTIFDNLHLPEGLEKDVEIGLIIMNCAELEILYTNPDFFKEALDYWSRAMLPTWQKLYNTMLFIYNPIHNKNADMRDEETIDRQRATTGGSEQDQTGHATQHAETDTVTHSTEERKVSAYNSNDYENRDLTDTDTTSHTDADSEVNTTQHANLGYREDEGQGEHRIFYHHEEGNIGVTSTQSMIKEEREVDLFEIYHHILADFKKAFCLLVY